MQNLFWTKSTTILTRLTAICAIGFIITCLSLAFISSHRTRSILDNIKIPQDVPVNQAPAPAPVGPVQNAAPAQPQAEMPAPEGGAE